MSTKIRIKPFLLALFLVAISLGVEAQTLRVAAWNLESGDSKTPTLSERVRSIRGVDIWGFSELNDQLVLNAMTVAAANGQSGYFKSVLGTTGGKDRLAIVYNSTRLRLESTIELDELNIGGNVRAPLAALFKDTLTNKRFYFMVNHLYRGSADGRHEQSRLLNDWAEAQDAPTITAGDFNYDLNVNNPDDHDDGFDLLTEDDVYAWARPNQLVKTQCSFNSVLDFVFVSGEAKEWPYESRIDSRSSDCPDTAPQSDHRPIVTTFTIGGSPGPAEARPRPTRNRREDILRRMRELERELRELRELLERTP